MNNGKLYENIDGIMRPLNLTLEQVNTAIEENKKLVEVQHQYDNQYAMNAELVEEITKLRGMINKARNMLYFTYDQRKT